MSMQSKRMVVCNQCHQSFEVTVWDSVNASLDPVLKSKVTNDELFIFECPHCGKKYYFKYDFLYHDMDAQLMVRYTYKEDIEEEKKEMLENVKQLEELKAEQNIQTIGDQYKYRLVNDYRRLLDKINIVDRNYDDRLMEIYKFILMTQVYDKDIENLDDIIFDRVTKESSPVFILLEKDLPEHYRTIGFNEEVYQGLEKEYGHMLNLVEEQLVVDLVWARAFFERITN